MLVRIGVAAAILGVCTRTLRRWEASGKLLPACRTAGGHRRYETT
ncbi:MAG: MerR family DNA-binding transcriptional regulator, partial [Promethearchaeota archaeon]